MILGFTGTREGLTIAQNTTLGTLLQGCDEFHHGDCLGADAAAHRLIRVIEQHFNKKIRIVLHPPNSQRFRAWCLADVVFPAKGYIPRNHDIVDCADQVVATPKESKEVPQGTRGAGTWATIHYARRLRKPLTIIWPNGLAIKESP